MDTIRLHRMLAYLKRRKRCSMAELMEKFGISQATAHRDVVALAMRDAVERVRGGVVYNDAAETAAAEDVHGYQERVVTHRAAKAAASAKAADAVTEGDILFIDSSTTAYEFALLLMRRRMDHLTIVTNAIPAMHLFRKFPPHWTLLGLGGNYDPRLNSLLGASALEQLSRINITKAFVSCFGLDDKCATTNHERQADFLRRVLDLAEKRYLIADHTKLGRKGLYRIAPRGFFDAILTD